MLWKSIVYPWLALSLSNPRCHEVNNSVLSCPLLLCSDSSGGPYINSSKTLTWTFTSLSIFFNLLAQRNKNWTKMQSHWHGFYIYITICFCLLKFFFYVYGAHERQKKTPDSLKFKLQVIVDYLTETIKSNSEPQTLITNL